MENLLTATEIAMFKGLSDIDVGLLMVSYAQEWHEDLEAGEVSAEEIEIYRQQHLELCAMYSRKLITRISDARRTYNLLGAGHRLKDGVRQELEGLQAVHANICRIHAEQRQWLSRFDARPPAVD